MRVTIYLKEVKPENRVAVVDNLEVVPRGLYVVNDKVYQYSGTPKFFIKKAEFRGIDLDKLVNVELIVEEYVEPVTNGGRTLI